MLGFGSPAVCSSQVRVTSMFTSALGFRPVYVRRSFVTCIGERQAARTSSIGESEDMGYSHHIEDLVASGRRAVLLHSAILVGVAGVVLPWPSVASEVDAEKKQLKLSIEQIKDIIQQDISQGQYFVTGALTKSIYRDDCKFKDPTNTTLGLDKYLKAVSILFEPATSKQELISIRVTGPKTVDAKWTLGGYLKFPWHPRVTTFEGSTQYTIDDDGLVALHDESWSISPLTALIESFTPSFK